MLGSEQFGLGMQHLSQKDNKDVEYVVPKEGGTIWADTLAIPKRCEKQRACREVYELLIR